MHSFCDKGKRLWLKEKGYVSKKTGFVTKSVFVGLASLKSTSMKNVHINY
jgi:hypothetical protein